MQSGLGALSEGSAEEAGMMAPEPVKRHLFQELSPHLGIMTTAASLTVQTRSIIGFHKKIFCLFWSQENT